MLLFSQSLCGLKSLIECAYLFASEFNDITYNPSKILQSFLKPPVSVCGIPVVTCQEYLGVKIGSAADQEKEAASKLYTNANLMLAQNRELKKCSHDVNVFV